MATTTLSSLRQLLAKRFPQAARGDARGLATGVPAIDDGVGGLPCGVPTEVVCARASCGGQLLLGELLQAVRRAGGRVALVDGKDGFDPQSWPEETLQHLVWARCRDTATALKAADLFARDANFQLVVLDLRRAPTVELRKTPASFWYRLQRAIEPADLALVVFTPVATVASAGLRLRLERGHDFETLEAARPELARVLAPVVQRQRVAASA